MVFETKSGSQFHRVPKLQGGPDAVYYGDILTSKASVKNPLTGSVFLLEHCVHPEPAPLYDHDETGVVLKGELWLQDETGEKAILQAGDTFFIHRNSTITFSTPRFAVTYKIAARPSPHL